MKTDVVIRQASSDDLPRVFQIEKGSFPHPYPLAFLRFLYEVNWRTFLIAEREGTIVGYVIASVEQKKGHIVSIAVHPSQRNREIGRALMAEVLTGIAAAGANSVRLEVRKSNIEAQRFYELLGFQRSRSIDRYYGDEDAVVYWKSL